MQAPRAKGGRTHHRQDRRDPHPTRHQQDRPILARQTERADGLRDLHPRALDDPRLLHLLHPHMDGTRADRQLFGQLGIRDPRILHQGGEDGLIEIIDPIIFRHFFALPLMISQ